MDHEVASRRMDLRLFCVGVGLATFATIALEIMLTRIFSVTMFYHFAFMVVSLALLGLAMAGVAVYLLPRVFAHERAGLTAGICMLAFALSGVLALHVALGTPIGLKSWQDNIGKLVLIYLATALPFLASGLAVTMAISSAGRFVGRVYAWDLIGAALGCLFVIPALSHLGAPGAILSCLALAAASAAILMASQRGPEGLRGRRYAMAAAGVVGVVLAVLALTEPTAQRFTLARNPEKFLGHRPVLFEKWNAFSHVAVARAGADDHRWIFIDHDAATRMWSGDIANQDYQPTRRIPEVRVASLAYSIRNQAPALVIGPGGGTDIISALYHGVERVVGVEINPIIVDDVMRGRFAEYSGDLYRDPRVEVVVDEGRSHIRRSGERYSVIQATLVDTWAASSSGAFTLSENNLYTVEAFYEFIDHLTPNGILAVTRWYDSSAPKEMLRLIAIGREALEMHGVAAAEVHEHVFVAADSERRGSLLVARQPLSREDIDTLARTCERGGLRILYSPLPVTGSLAGNGGRNSNTEDALFARYLQAESSRGFLDQLEWDLTPPTDDKPFFFYTLRPGQLMGVMGQLSSVDHHNLGVLILLLLLLLAVVLTLVFVLLPLFVFRRSALREGRGRKVRVLSFFLALGLGFIMVEIGLMQKFVLFLGHPIYSLAVILASLLAASGTGSALSQRGCDRWGVRGMVVRSGAVLIGLLLLFAFALTPLFHALLGIELWARIAIAVVLVFALGLPMGSMLPCGVRTANPLGSGIVAWAWGLNGATSVVGSILAMVVSMNAGFTGSLGLGAAAYIVGMLVLPGTRAIERA